MAEKEEGTEVEKNAMDEAVEHAKKTASALQGLLSKVSAGVGFYKRTTEEDEKIEPQLSYESRSDTQDLEIEKLESSSVAQEPSFIDAEGIDSNKVVPRPPGAPPPPPAPKAAPAPLSEREKLYSKLGDFFEEFIGGYNETYKRWENSISNILSILRKMRKITKKNTEDLVNSITSIFENAKEGLDQFKTKRNEIEKVSGVNIESLSGEFKRVLGLLELQIKEYQLKKESDSLLQDYEVFSN